MRNKYFIYSILLAIFFVAFLLRFYNLGQIPPGIHGDEGEFGLLARKIIDYQYQSFFSNTTDTIFSFSVLSFWVQGIFFKLFREPIFALRFSSALAGILTVVLFFFLSRLFFKNLFIATLITLAIATSHWHIAYSRLALSVIWTPFFIVAILLFFLRGIQQKTSTSNFAIAGFFLGLSQYFHYTVKVIPIICVLWSVVYFLQNIKTKRLAIRNVFIFFVTSGIVFFPQAIYYFQHPDKYIFRIDTVSVFNHLPEYYERFQVKTVFEVLFLQFINTMKVFNFGGDSGWWIYGYQGGLLAPIAGALGAIGLFISIWKMRQEKYAYILIWFFSIIILGGTLTIYAPSSPRIIGVIPVLFLFVGVSLENIIKIRLRYLSIFLITLFIINGLWDYKIYFLDYIHSQAGWAQREPATQVAYYLKSLGTNWKVYMLRENTWLYFHHGTIQFINPNLEGLDVDSSENEIPAILPTKKNIVYIMPPNSPSIDRLKLFYPEGKRRYFFNPISNSPSFESYEINRQNL